MNVHLLEQEIQDFINDNLDSDIVKLALKKNIFEHVTFREISEQIFGKNKVKTKLPSWFNAKNIYYPKKINLEQTSSEITANYKATLTEGNSVIDLTGGFGVDCFAFSKKSKAVTHCEISEELSEIVKHNFKQLGSDNINCISGDGPEILKNSDSNFDWIYIDPSRRNDSKGKVFMLRDCLPNIPENIELLFEKSAHILIKNSPLLDISNGINELKFVKTIHVIGINNEVKELLFELEKGYEGSIEITTVNFNKKSTQNFNFELGKTSIATTGEVNQFLYEPNACILKAGAFSQISEAFNIDKLHDNSHLYTSENYIENFPGRIFEVIQTIPYNNKRLKKLGISKANITTRNFPLSVSEIRKKTKIKDGGKDYLFFTTDYQNNLIVVVCKKPSSLF